MGVKIRKILVVIFLLLFWTATIPVFAGAELVRVGITDNKFQNVLKQEVRIYATAEACLCDKQTRRVLMNIPAETDVLIRNNLSGLEFTVGSNSAILRDFVLVSPAGLLGVRDLTRKGLPAIYHGAFEDGI